MAPTDSDGTQYVVGSYRAASVLDVVQIGGTVLKKPMCEDGLAQKLMPGRQACLYVWRNGLLSSASLMTTPAMTAEPDLATGVSRTCAARKPEGKRHTTRASSRLWVVIPLTAPPP